MTLVQAFMQWYMPGRIANASEYGQWVPTYGSALRPDRFGYLVFE